MACCVSQIGSTANDNQNLTRLIISPSLLLETLQFPSLGLYSRFWSLINLGFRRYSLCPIALALSESCHSDLIGSFSWLGVFSTLRSCCRIEKPCSRSPNAGASREMEHWRKCWTGVVGFITTITHNLGGHEAKVNKNKLADRLCICSFEDVFGDNASVEFQNPAVVPVPAGVGHTAVATPKSP
jgi:hypothetical protein